MPHERLTPLDASFLHIEDGVTHMHIGSVSVFEGPIPDYDRFVAMVASKLPLVRRYRQVVREVPFDLGRPVWADDPWFDVEYHIRHTAVPAPGDSARLCALVGRLMGQPLDRRRPLWEMWMVEGLPEGQWALVSKVHHCMVDGVSGSELLGLILDSDPEPPRVEPLPWTPGLPPSGLDLAYEAVVGALRSPIEIQRVLRARTRPARRLAESALEAVRVLREAAASVGEPSSNSLNGPIGPHRRWVPAVVTVDDVKAVRARLGGTFNDVVLALVTRGFRDLLEHRGEATDVPVRTLVPVSVGPRDERGMPVGDGSLSNRVSAVFADLPVGLEDPAARLHAVRESMAGLKESGSAVAGEVLTSLSGFAPPVLLALAGRLGARMPQARVNTVTTNVPGPQLPLYAAGRRMLAAYPYVPLAMHVRIGVAIFSYDGKVTFGITGDFDSCPDIGVLAAGIEAGMSELLSLAVPEAKIIDLRASRTGART